VPEGRTQRDFRKRFLPSFDREMYITVEVINIIILNREVCHFSSCLLGLLSPNLWIFLYFFLFVPLKTEVFYYYYNNKIFRRMTYYFAM
jgi:hypothetical protein